MSQQSSEEETFMSNSITAEALRIQSILQFLNEYLISILGNGEVNGTFIKDIYV